MILVEDALLFTLLFQLIIAVILPFIYRCNVKLFTITTFSASVANVYFAVNGLFFILEEGVKTYQLGSWANYLGIEIIYDYVTALVVLLIAFIFLVIICYAIAELKEELDKEWVGWYFTLLFLLNSSMCGMVMAFDIFNLYVFMEVSLIASVAIVAIKDNPESIQASVKYLILNAIGSGCILLGIGMLYQVTGYLNFAWIAQEIGAALSNHPQVVMAVFSLFVVGFFLKAAVFPLYVWLPDAHSTALTPSSAILSGLLIKIYALALIRIIYSGFYPIILELTSLATIMRVLAILSILIGSLFAIIQTDIKRMLAYSSVSQIGYIIFGFSLFNSYGLQGSLLHIINHAFIKTGLFLAVGNIIHATGQRRMDKLTGIGKRMPITFAAFSLGALAMIGIPPLNGFFSKWYLALGSFKAGEWLGIVVIIVSSLLNAFYYLPVIIKGFFYEPRIKLDQVEEVSPGLYIPAVLLGIGCLVLGLSIEWSMELINQAANTLLTMGG